MEKEYRHNNKVAIYRSADGETQLSVEIDKDTVWLNANQMAELFGRDSKTIRKHINNAIREELAGEVVVAKFAPTTQHGAMEAKSQTHDSCASVTEKTLWMPPVYTQNPTQPRNSCWKHSAIRFRM